MTVSSNLRTYDLGPQVKRETELSADHYLLLSWIRWQVKLPEGCGEAKFAVRVHWERLAEAPIWS